MQYVFAKTVNADTPDGASRRFLAGEAIDEAEILACNLRSCVANGHAAPVEAEESDATEESDAIEESQVDATGQTGDADPASSQAASSAEGEQKTPPLAKPRKPRAKKHR